MLGIVSWRLDKYTRSEVLTLICRYYRPEEAYRANEMLAEACKLEKQNKHRNSPFRSVDEANAVDLVNNMGKLDDEKRAPRYLIPSEELGTVPLGALGIRDEVSVSARLESLEDSMKKVSSILEKVQANTL